MTRRECDRCHAPIGRDWPRIQDGRRVVCWQCAEAKHLVGGLLACPPDYAPAEEPPLVADERDAGVAMRVAFAVLFVLLLLACAWLRGKVLA